MSADTDFARAQADWPLEDERLFWREVCAPRRHPEWLWWFMYIATGYGFYMQEPENKKWFTEEVHKPYVGWLQGHVDEWIAWRYRGLLRRKKLASELPRNHGKTQMNSIALPLALALEFPDMGWGLDSETKEKAAEHLLDPLRAIMEGNDRYGWFTWLYGKFVTARGETEGRRANRREYLVHNFRRDLSRKDKSFICWGVRTGATGKHPDGASIDDLVSEEKLTEDETWLEACARHVRSFKYATEDHSFVIHSYTRYRKDDPAGVLYEEEGVRSWSGQPCPDPELELTGGQWDVFHLSARTEDGSALCPTIITTEQLDEEEAADPISFARQRMNNPGMERVQLVTTKEMNACYINRDALPQHGRVYIHCDTAFKDVQNMGQGDESVAEFWLHHPARPGVVIFLFGFGSALYDVERFTAQLTKDIMRFDDDPLLQNYKIMGVTDEVTAAGKKGAWFAYFRQYMASMGRFAPPCFELSRGGSMKTTRVANAAAYIKSGRVQVLRGAPGAREYCNQMIHWRTLGKRKKDWADAGADVFDKQTYRPATTSRPAVDTDGRPTSGLYRGKWPRTLDGERDSVTDLA